MFRALLIGVPEYRDATFPSMPFIEDDLAELSEALEQTGYEVDVHDRNATDSDGIKDAIESFIADAVPDAQLLIYLSGHGVHSEGMDYLVSSSAVLRVSRFPSGNCVPINCDAHISRSQAASVLVVVDACREGVKVQTKSISVSGWGDLQRDRALARKVAYFYAWFNGWKVPARTSRKARSNPARRKKDRPPSKSIARLTTSTASTTAWRLASITVVKSPGSRCTPCPVRQESPSAPTKHPEAWRPSTRPAGAPAPPGDRQRPWRQRDPWHQRQFRST